MTSVYRVPEAAGAGGKPTTLAYHPLRRGHGSSMKGYLTLISPLFAGAIVGGLGFHELVVPTMVVSGVGLYLFRRRAKALPAAILRIEGPTLRALGPSGREIVAVPLAELIDITLETKTIEMVLESPGPVPELMYVNSTVGPALDTARIQVVTRQGGPIPLTEEFMPHSDSLEWRGKMRQFLRKHDWKPEEPTPAPAAAKKRKAKARRAEPDDAPPPSSDA